MFFSSMLADGTYIRQLKYCKLWVLSSWCIWYQY